MLAKRHRQLFSSLAVILLGSVLTLPALGQNAPSDPSAGNDAGVAAPAASGATGMSPAAQRKAARKQARAKRTAELKKLEDAGYKPGRDDPNYPDDLQAA
jgi:hypothetical protein